MYSVNLPFLSEKDGEQQTKDGQSKACCCKDDIHHCETQGNCHHLLNWYSINRNTICLFAYIIHFYFHIHVGKYLTRKHERVIMGFKCTVIINKNYANLSSNLC